MIIAKHLRMAVTALVFCLTAVPAFAADLTLDNLTIKEDKGVLRIARVDVTNTNFTRDELQRLLDTSADGKGSLELLARFTADRMAISGATFAGDEGTMIFAPILATGIDKGRVAKLASEGVDITLKNMDGGAGDLKIRALEIERADFAALLNAVLAGRPDLIDFQAEKIVWAGFDLSLPDEHVKADAPGGNRIHVGLRSLNATTTYQGKLPVLSSADIGNLVIELSPTSEGARNLANIGYKKLDFSISGHMRYDPATRDMTIDDYTMTGVDVGRLVISGKIGNLDPALFGPGTPEVKMAASILANLSALEIRFVNEGAVDKGFAYAAAEQGKTAPALRSEVSLMAGQMLPLLLGGNPAALPLARGVQDFLRDSRNFTLTLKSRGAPVPLSSLASLGDPATFFALVDVELKSNQ